MDLPGHYPITSLDGNKNIFIMYDTDSKYIKPLAMTSRETNEILRCFKECYDYFKKANFTARLLRLDNEVSKRLIDRIETEGLEYQLAAPYDHRRNPAERAIQSFKNHFISIRAGADPDFPADRWDLFLAHAEDTINMSRPSQINPKVSACTMINGQFDFNKTPMCPAGIKTIAHTTTDRQTTWEEHGGRSFGLGRAPNHFRCYRNLIVKTNAIRVSNTVEFFPVKCGNPMLSEEEKISLLLQDLITIVSNPTRTIPSISYGDELNNALRTMQELMCKNRHGTQRVGNDTSTSTSPSLSLGHKAQSDISESLSTKDLDHKAQSDTSESLSTQDFVESETANNPKNTKIVPETEQKCHVEPRVIPTNIDKPRVALLKQQRPTTRS